MTYSKLDDPDYLCVQIVELTAENERLTAENQHLFDRANDVMAENQRLTDQIRKLVDSFNSGEIGAWAGAVINEDLAAENERLRAALRPFADAWREAEKYADKLPGGAADRLNAYDFVQAAEALAPDYFQRGLAAAPGLVLTGTEEQE